MNELPQNLLISPISRELGEWIKRNIELNKIEAYQFSGRKLLIYDKTIVVFCDFIYDEKSNKAAIRDILKFYQDKPVKIQFYLPLKSVECRSMSVYNAFEIVVGKKFVVANVFVIMHRNRKTGPSVAVQGDLQKALRFDETTGARIDISRFTLAELLFDFKHFFNIREKSSFKDDEEESPPPSSNHSHDFPSSVLSAPRQLASLSSAAENLSKDGDEKASLLEKGGEISIPPV
jgi:hypothetical protein